MFYEKNLNILKKLYPDILKIIQKSEKEKSDIVEIEEFSQDKVKLKIEGEKIIFYETDKRKSEEIWNYNKNLKTNIVLFGMGIGFEFLNLFNKFPEYKIYVVEKNVGIFQVNLYLLDLSKS